MNVYLWPGYDLLSSNEQTLLRHLSVFVDGWTLDAAEAMLAETTRRWPQDPGNDLLVDTVGVVTHQSLPRELEENALVGRLAHRTETPYF